MICQCRHSMTRTTSVNPVSQAYCDRSEKSSLCWRASVKRSSTVSTLVRTHIRTRTLARLVGELVVHNLWSHRVYFDIYNFANHLLTISDIQVRLARCLPFSLMVSLIVSLIGLPRDQLMMFKFYSEFYFLVCYRSL